MMNCSIEELEARVANLEKTLTGIVSMIDDNFHPETTRSLNLIMNDWMQNSKTLGSQHNPPFIKKEDL